MTNVNRNLHVNSALFIKSRRYVTALLLLLRLLRLVS